MSFDNEIKPKFSLMDYSAGPHQAITVRKFQFRKNIARMVWRSWSSDFNPSENVGSELHEISLQLVQLVLLKVTNPPQNFHQLNGVQ